MKAHEVGEGFESWNAAIGAEIGSIVVCPDGSEMWCDEEGLCKGIPVLNLVATMIAGQPIVGYVILFRKGDIK